MYVTEGTAPEITLNGVKRCQWCGSWHQEVCWKIKAIEYYPDGTPKRVEFKSEPHSAN